MYLEKIHLKNFRSFESAEIPLQKDITIFVGENNGGKSNAIDAIRLLTQPLGGRRELYCEPTDVRFQSDERVFDLEAHFAGLSVPQQGRFISATADTSLEKAVFGLNYDPARPGTPRPTLWSGALRSTPEQGCHDMVRHVYLPPLRDAKRALASGNPTRIIALLNHFLDGTAAGDVAKSLGRTNSHEILGRIDGAVRKSLNALTMGARLQTASLSFSTDESLIDIARDLRFKLADHGVYPEDLEYSGHGYANLLYMAIIAVELEKVKTADLTLFLVEEPEAHLHPQLQAAVLCFLQEQAELSQTKDQSAQGPAGELQVIVATHSPNLSAWVPNEKLVVFKSIATPVSVAAPVAVSSEAGVAEQLQVPASADRPTVVSKGTAAAKIPDIIHNAKTESRPSPPPSADEVRPQAKVSAALSAPSPLKRRVTRCIPLAQVSMTPEDRRKIDRYLDVTKSSVLFGGRTLLVEGIAEAILIPVIAKHYILKGKPEKYRLFRSAVFVPIDGIDFEPYANLLLATHNGVRITDRLVIITDGDSGATDEDRVAGGVARKTALDTLAKRLGAAETFEAIINTYSLEAEMVASGNDALLRQVYVSKDIHPRSGKKWDDAVALPEPADRAAALRTIFKDVRKGDFAHLLARRIEDGEAFVVPDYIKKAIEALVAE